MTTTTINTTTVAPVVIPMSSGRSLATSCLLGAGSPFSGGSDLRGTGFSLNVPVAAEAFVVVERPTPALVAEAAWTSRSAYVAAGAGHQTKPVSGYAATQQLHSTKRAFRGLTPWRDPA